MEKGKKYVFDEKSQTFKEGKASPWLPPEQMRGLPADYTTKDPSDPDRIHELDPPHIVEALTEEQKKAEEEPPSSEAVEALKALFNEVYIGRRVPITQERVDVVKFISLWNFVKAQSKKIAAGLQDDIDWRIHHLWFPTPYMHRREKRLGKPPSRILRPAWLKDIDLVLDLDSWPRSVCDRLEELGLETPRSVRATYEAFRAESAKPLVML